MSKSAKSNSKTLSTWTPLNNEESNKKVFLERRELFCKWFEKWSEPQRKKIIADVLKLSNQSQLYFTDKLVSAKLPTKERDFTRVLPRVLSLYILSYLDPRSLCRLAQVCWYWKFLAELDQLWMLKCLKLGWTLPFAPGPYEHGLWKRNYVENLKSLQYLKTQMDIRKQQEESLPPTPVPEVNLPDDMRHYGSLRSYRSTMSQHSRQGNARSKPSGPVKPAWRGGDPTPKDTWRYNYLNNDDEVEIVKAMRAHGMSGPKSAAIAASAKSKTKSGRHALNTKSKSMSFDSESSLGTARSTISQKLNGEYSSQSLEQTMEEKIYGGRPDWAKPGSTQHGYQTQPDTRSYPTESDVRSQPVVSARSASQQGHREFLTRTPIKSDNPLPVAGEFEVFAKKPWRIPVQDDSD